MFILLIKLLSLIHFSLVMEIWFKVLEKSWNSIGQHVYEP